MCAPTHPETVLEEEKDPYVPEVTEEDLRRQRDLPPSTQLPTSEVFLSRLPHVPGAEVKESELIHLFTDTGYTPDQENIILI